MLKGAILMPVKNKVKNCTTHKTKALKMTAILVMGVSGISVPNKQYSTAVELMYIPVGIVFAVSLRDLNIYRERIELAMAVLPEGMPCWTRMSGNRTKGTFHQFQKE